jgi:hypothetical protein
MIEAIAQESMPQLGTRVQGLRDDSRDRKIQATPFEVRIGAMRQGRFEDVRDAIASARISKKDRPLSRICVADLTTGQIVLEIEH